MSVLDKPELQSQELPEWSFRSGTFSLHPVSVSLSFPAPSIFSFCLLLPVPSPSLFHSGFSHELCSDPHLEQDTGIFYLSSDSAS